ncbi:MAG: DNA (cytosine-5-)-methyltransferase [Thermodesulfovibrio sp.]|nr:DNA (cytosine-5-)-methyltransferase [Thermodesulfovibrio sp.]
MRYIDLFAGAGGFSEGFKRAGFEPIAHVEIDEAACNTLRTRLAYYYLTENGKTDTYVRYLKGEITRDQLYSTMPEEVLESVIHSAIGDRNNPEIFKEIDKLKGSDPIDIIVGGPPCQAYSLVGRARDKNKMKGDPRNYLYLQYGEYLKRYKPKIFVFENVPGMLSAAGGKYFRDMKQYFESLNYHLKPEEVNANQFGVLQNRKRIIVIGWRKDSEFAFDFSNVVDNSRYTVAMILKDLPIIGDGEGKDKFLKYRGPINDYLALTKIRNGINVLTQHVARPHNDQDKKIYRIAVDKWSNEQARLDYNDLPEKLMTHKNRHSFLDRFKVVAADLPYSQTVVAHIAKDGHYYIHPDIGQNRSISVREAARLQSFPDDYYFEGIKEGQNRTAAFKQIGNAVPPLMIESIAKKIRAYLIRK